MLRLGEVEAHAHLPLNWARIKSSSGRLRPQARTTSRRGRVLTAGDYRIEVRERIATLSELGVLHKPRALPRAQDRSSAIAPGPGEDLPGQDKQGTAAEDAGLAEAEAKKFAELDAYAKHIAAQLKVSMPEGRGRV